MGSFKASSQGTPEWRILTLPKPQTIIMLIIETLLIIDFNHKLADYPPKLHYISERQLHLKETRGQTTKSKVCLFSAFEGV